MSQFCTVDLYVCPHQHIPLSTSCFFSHDRFFFLDWCEEIGLEAHQEYVNDSDFLPRHKGRITGRIERV